MRVKQLVHLLECGKHETVVVIYCDADGQWCVTDYIWKTNMNNGPLHIKYIRGCNIMHIYVYMHIYI